VVKERDNPSLPSLCLEERKPWFCGRQTRNLSAAKPEVGMRGEVTPFIQVGMREKILVATYLLHPARKH
jgi:hypothetical protein